MTTAQQRGPDLTGMTPVLCVDDMPASLEHYTQVLGFEVAWAWSDDEMFEGGRPTFVCVFRGDVSLFLGERRQGNPGSWLCVFVEGKAALEELHQEYQASGANVLEPPEDRPWGNREMLVADLDGNVFRIGCSSDAD